MVITIIAGTVRPDRVLKGLSHDTRARAAGQREVTNFERVYIWGLSRVRFTSGSGPGVSFLLFLLISSPGPQTP